MTNGVRYDYSITPYNALSGGSYWSYASAAPGIGAAPTNFTATAGNLRVTLSWNVVSGAYSYYMYRKKSTDTTWVNINTTYGSSTSYLDTGLTSGVLYNYSICVGNPDGTKSAFSYADATPYSLNPPSTPTGLVASSSQSSIVRLSWSAVADTTSYDVLRSTANGGSYGFQATVSTNAWSDTAVTNGTTYYYVVVAKNSFGSSAYFNQDSVTPLAAPTGLSAIPGTSTCYLSWNPVVGATSYNVRRQYQPSTSGYPQINQFSTTATNYRDSFPSQGFISYNYSVQAVSSKATGDFSSIGVYPASVDSDLNTLSLSPVTVQGGTSVTGTVTLTNSPQSGNAVISLSSNNAAAIVPASVTIVGGTTSTTFPVTTTSVTTQQTATITASYAGITKTATLTITVPPAGNRAPVANAQNVSTNEDTAKAVTLTATDADNDPLTYSISTPPTKGTLSGTAPNLTYTPNLNANGSDSFAFRANDGKVDSNIATVNITINPVNDAPVATAQNISTTKNTAKSGTLTATDVDSSTLTFSKVTDPTHGTATVASNGAFTYTPATDYTGGDSFTFKANDGALDSNSAIVSITVSAPTAFPVLSTFTLTPTSGVGGSGFTSTGTLSLSSAAPAGGIVVNLSSDNAAAQVPTTVTVPAGQSSTQFTVTTSAVTANITANISATYNGVTVTKPLTITVSGASSSPTGLTATGRYKKIELRWTGVSGATSYIVRRSLSSTGNFSPVTTVTSPTTNYTDADTSLTVGTTYYYDVIAVNSSSQQSVPSAQASAAPKPAFEVVGLTNGGTLSGRVVIQMNVYEEAAASQERWKLTVDGIYFCSAVQQFPLNGASRLSFPLKTYLLSNGQHTLQMSDGTGRAATYTVSFQNSFSQLSYTPIFDTTGSMAGAGVGSTATITGNVSSGVGWTVAIQTSKDQPVKTFTGVGNGTSTSINVAWNGRDEAGALAPVGNYKLYVNVTPTGTSGMTANPFSSVSATNSSAPGENVGIVNDIINSETLIVIDEETEGGSASALSYVNNFMDHMKLGNTGEFNVNNVVPIMVTDLQVESPVEGQPIRDAINARLARPLKLFYFDGHGRSYSVPQFRIGTYRWLSKDPGTSIGEGQAFDPTHHFDVSRIIREGGLEYGGDSGIGLTEVDPLKLVWIDTCASAGGVGSATDYGSGNELPGERSIPGVNFGWDECFGISRGYLNGYQGVFVGFSGAVPIPSGSDTLPNWRQWRQSLWCYTFRDHNNIGVTHNFDGSAAFLASSLALYKADVNGAALSDGTLYQPQYLRRATGNPSTAF